MGKTNLLILEYLTAFIGAAIITYFDGIGDAVGFFFLMWSNNIDQERKIFNKVQLMIRFERLNKEENNRACR